MASNFLKNTDDWEVIIPNTTERDGVVLFLIQIRVGAVKWVVEHRYREFFELHKVLTLNHSVPKDILPPKVFFGSHSQQFIETRREGLETYINKVLRFLSNTMPPDLVTFLEMDKYDLWFLFRGLARQIRENNWIDRPPKDFQMSILEVSAISERLRLPCPPTGIIDSQLDFCTVLEFCTCLKEIIISGDVKEFIGTSNINYKNIPFELSCFRYLRAITFSNLFIGNIIRADEIRNQVKSLKAVNCKLKNIVDLLLCDNIHKNWNQIPSSQAWQSLEKIDLSCNFIYELDSGLELIHHVTDFNISFNQISSLNPLSKLQQLSVIRLSHNCITAIENCNIQFPCVKYLDLSNNKISCLIGMTQFPSLETLNLSFNLIDTFDELNYISMLPNILNVDLIGNPISQKTDYRVKVLEKFGKRTSLLCLDNEQSTVHELELIALVQAIRFVQEGRSLSYNKNLSFEI